MTSLLRLLREVKQLSLPRFLPTRSFTALMSPTQKSGISTARKLLSALRKSEKTKNSEKDISFDKEIPESDELFGIFLHSFLSLDHFADDIPYDRKDVVLHARMLLLCLSPVQAVQVYC